MIGKHYNDDRASGRSYTWIDRIRSTLITRQPGIHAGDGVIVKRHAAIKMTENATLTIGDNVVLHEYSLLMLTKPAPSMKIGDNVGIGRNSLISCKESVIIGADTLISPFVHIADNTHSMARGATIKSQKARIAPVVIGADVWVGAGARILPGITIGDGAVIGANSVVNKSVAPYTLAAGVPIHVIGKRT